MRLLSFTTLVEAPLTVAFDVARVLGRPWPAPLEELESVRPLSDVHTGSWPGGHRVTHSRRFTPTAEGTLVEERIELRGRRSGPLTGRLLRRRLRRAMTAHLAAYVVAAEARAQDVVQVVGAALVDGVRVLAAQRSGGPYDGCWEFPGGKVEPGESDLAALVRECAEELGVVVAPEGFLGEVPLDGVVAGGPRGASTMRVWSARIVSGEPVAHEHAALRWIGADELDGLDWIAADRPLLPAVRALLAPSDTVR
ncbi:(deoxy)nucleoside triphosphate pyrophosphohydrolase [Blastococcus sp. TML/M2B]|uniref:(deoxy)nucleoside triphosphate pyrophosphohydrolase n=1 Tax=unclassified Blastococcus TaxID=2619396 RepID=UPI00190B5EC8|nr:MULTISPECIES: (deoxy)nucleoside triphosphate pyrophosphohydrolase [unclassified Blastococcus]MBN1091685.1 (deoxy)nucleoside triphosphate pyrophosphohydrolase [Blastococcus sp. TML/M2B]MBN1094757.1 (deoxy)nucleoside triphosphate pyrophosphohydrolase [Blastococcus sp. TML/C7B]